MRTLLGRLAPGAAGDTVEVAFEDGTTDDAPMHGRWFAYAVAGERTEPGHRPRQLLVRNGDDIVRRFSMDPTSFNTLAEARALVPAGNGSRGQEAVRRVLLSQLTTTTSDGGALASHTVIAQTKLVASLAFAHGRRLAVYGAPVLPIQGWNARGSILVGLDSRAAHPAFWGFGVGGRRGAHFASPAGCSCSLNLHTKGTFWYLHGDVPLGVARVSVRTRAGREVPAGVFNNGREWVWLGHDNDIASQQPIALLGRNAAGAVVATKRLHQTADHLLR
jgi:hypothetical protein